MMSKIEYLSKLLKKFNYKKYLLIPFFVVFSVFYLLEYFTIHKFGKEYVGIVTSVETESGKCLKYVLNNHIQSFLTHENNLYVDDYMFIYHKEYFFGEYVYSGNRTRSQKDKLLIFSENIPSEIDSVFIFIDNQLFKKIDVSKINNFGVWINRYSEKVIVKYNLSEKLIFYPENEQFGFKEVR